MKLKINEILNELDKLAIDVNQLSLVEIAKGIEHEYEEHFTGEFNLTKLIEEENINKILCLMVLVHLKEDEEYYTHLEEMEEYFEDEDEDEEETN